MVCGFKDVCYCKNDVAAVWRGRCAARQSDLVSRFSGEVRQCAWSLFDFGDRLGRWRGKCLQNALLGLARGPLWLRLQRRFVGDACDHEGASLCGRRAERRNLVLVWKALRAERPFSWSVASRSQLHEQGV